LHLPHMLMEMWYSFWTIVKREFLLQQKNVKIGKMMREHDCNYQPWSKWGNGNMMTIIHFTPKFQGTFIKYHGTFKSFATYIWKWNGCLKIQWR
jgi:hypothetical protein